MNAKALLFGCLCLSACGIASAESSQVKACFDRPAERWSTLDQRECLRQVLHDANNELSTVYGHRQAQASRSDAERRERMGKAGTEAERLEASQKAWSAYRDAECWGFVGGGEPGEHRGSGTEGTILGCAAEKTLQRVEELKVPFDRR